MGWLKLFLRINKEIRILVLGLDGAGKTTLIYKLKLGEKIESIPTIGFNVEECNYKNLNFILWDIGGQDKIRKLWKHYYHGTDGLIFMIDSNDPDRFKTAKEELYKLLNEDELKKIPILVYVNKQDLGTSKTPYEISRFLELNSISGHEYFLQPCSAISGNGIFEGLDWLSEKLK